MRRYADYRRMVHEALWRWADLHHRGQLDNGERQERPPVLASRFASDGILVPPSDNEATAIRAAIQEGQRHRWFRSLSSSQALIQSVFGAIAAFDRFDVFQGVLAECRRLAFFDDHRGWSLVLEHDVRGPNEPRPTSIDTFLRGPHRRITVECKFTEQGFGVCSRPRLHPRDPAYAEQYCDGSYRAQRGRRERCALTGISVRYWEHLPPPVRLVGRSRPCAVPIWRRVPVGTERAGRSHLAGGRVRAVGRACARGLRRPQP